MSERVTLELNQGVADVRFNRPEKHNALDAEQFRAVRDMGMALLERTDIRAVVLSGNGPSFCSGIDYPSFMAAGPESLLQAFGREGLEPANNAQTLAWVWKQVPVPVIAAVQGVAFGGGCQLALGADIRIAHPEARLSVMEVEYGLIPDMGASLTLRELVRMDIAKELTFTGRIVGAEEAERLGLVTRISERPLEAAMELARSIAGRSPDAIRGAKKLLEGSWHGDAAVGLQLEENLQKELLGSPNQMEAVTARLQKRTPAYQDPQAE